MQHPEVNVGNRSSDSYNKATNCLQSPVESLNRTLKSSWLEVGIFRASGTAWAGPLGKLAVVKEMADLFHLVPKDTWVEHKAAGTPYYPNTYDQVRAVPALLAARAPPVVTPCWLPSAWQP